MNPDVRRETRLQLTPLAVEAAVEEYRYVGTAE
jgi:hypothetical protein